MNFELNEQDEEDLPCFSKIAFANFILRLRLLAETTGGKNVKKLCWIIKIMLYHNLIYVSVKLIYFKLLRLLHLLTLKSSKCFFY